MQLLLLPSCLQGGPVQLLLFLSTAQIDVSGEFLAVSEKGRMESSSHLLAW